MMRPPQFSDDSLMPTCGLIDDAFCGSVARYMMIPQFCQSLRSSDRDAYVSGPLLLFLQGSPIKYAACGHNIH
jgi:hypothetical protein